MTPKEAIECLKNEKLCILIADKNECTRECSKCDLIMETDTLLTAYDMAIEAIEKQAEYRNRIKDLITIIENICKDSRERHTDDEHCGLCEYDGAYIGESGDWCNECPGFEKDDCFVLSNRFKRKYVDWSEEE